MAKKKTVKEIAIAPPDGVHVDIAALTDSVPIEKYN